MQVLRICEVYFSPCGSVKKIVSEMARFAAMRLNIPVETIDFTLPEARKNTYEFKSTDLVFFGTPVYAGRVPNKIMPYIKEAFIGNDAAAVPVVVFGNRSFDDALVELKILLDGNRFHTVAGAAVVSRHSFSYTIASGRPNKKDYFDMKNFVVEILEKIQEAKNSSLLRPVYVSGVNPPEKYYTPLGTDGKPAKFLKAHPKTDLLECDQCGICAKNCPMGSIDPMNTQNITGICIKCQACIRKCPKNAKYFDDKDFLSHKRMLEETFTAPNQSRFFV